MKKAKAKAKPDATPIECACRVVGDDGAATCGNTDSENYGECCVFGDTKRGVCLDSIPFQDEDQPADPLAKDNPGDACPWRFGGFCRNKDLPARFNRVCAYGDAIPAECEASFALPTRDAATDDADAPAPIPSVSGELMQLAPHELMPSPYQGRAIRGTPELDAALEELAASIRANGVVQPLAVRRVTAGYEIVAGHRRHAAATLAGVATVPCYVVVATDAQAESALVAENLQRVDLSPIEEADSVARMAARGMSPAQIAAAAAKSTRWVYRRLALAAVVPEWREFGNAQKLSAAFLGEIARLPAPTQRLIYDEMECAKIARGEAEDYQSAWTSNGGDIDQIREAVSDATRELDSAPWGEYRPDYCAACTKRSDRNPDLFENGEGEPRCLDPACWERKGKDWLKIARKTLAERHGKAEEVAESVTWRVNTRAAKQKGYSTPAVIQDGRNAGRVVWLEDPKPAADDGRPGPAVQRGPTPQQKADAREIRRVEEWLAGKETPPDAADLVTLVAMATDFALSPFDLVPPGDIGRDNYPHGRRATLMREVFIAGGDDAMRLALWQMLRTKLRQALGYDTVSNCGMAKRTADALSELLAIPAPETDAGGVKAGKRARKGA